MPKKAASKPSTSSKPSTAERRYVDGFVLSVPTDKIAEYRKLARSASKVWREHGALEYFECVGDDLIHEGMWSFPKIAKTKPDETVVFAWIAYESKKHRDEVNKKVMADPRLAKMMQPGGVPFDPKRMTYGGFKVIVQA